MIMMLYTWYKILYLDICMIMYNVAVQVQVYCDILDFFHECSEE